MLGATALPGRSRESGVVGAAQLAVLEGAA